MLDSILFWNDVALEVHREGRAGEVPDPARDAPALGAVHLAMYDAYVAVAKPAEFAPHLQGLPAPPEGALASAAVAGAAHEVLSALLPDQRAFLDGKLAEAGVPAGDPGLAFGRLVGAALLEERAGDPRRDEPGPPRGRGGAPPWLRSIAVDADRPAVHVRGMPPRLPSVRVSMLMRWSGRARGLGARLAPLYGPQAAMAY